MKLDTKKYIYHNTGICDAHKIMKVETSMDICCMVKGEMKKQKIKFTFEAPEAYRVNSTIIKNKQTLKRKHTTRERRVLREWGQCYDNHKKQQEKNLQTTTNPFPSHFNKYQKHKCLQKITNLTMDHMFLSCLHWD